ncbi:MAG TPA: alanine--tRNA ligase [Chloroflexota bacterium]|nr:alanine--tRNA ligase [Chloroflexota bacterium]HZU07776.1 alanine--tRNA ligase [Chloroflexota bacterium]
MTDLRREEQWSSERLRSLFVDFFKEKGSLEVPSSSLVPQDDPTVLLTTAGMQQFIPYMLGRREPPARRLVSVQKCFRTTDIDEVGNPRTLTFFEMLGNFSIGDYFKAEAIAWAWEFVTERLGLPRERLWVTVHPTDEEAAALWLDQGVPAERIRRLEDNWWGPPGLAGPCGPDSEIYIDRGPALGCGRPDCGPGCDCDRFLEIWNLVFMQYYQDEHGRREPLAQRNIDTGMGLERIAAVMQNVPTVYETDLFRPLLARITALTGQAYGADPRQDFSMRVLADHSRAMTFLVSDGVFPSNEGRGYVLRRIIRRAVRYGRLLGLTEPFLAPLVDVVCDLMGGRYPLLVSNRAEIQRVIAQEEARFLATLQSGLALLERWIAEARASGTPVLAGERLFRLYDTYGFPYELSVELLREAGLQADEAGYRRALEEQRARSRAAAGFGHAAGATLAASVADAPPTLFLGYTTTVAPGRVLALRTAAGLPCARLRTGERGAVVLDESPFYAEAGGQVGDQGELRGAEALFVVEDTQADEAGHILHLGYVAAGELATGMQVEARVDAERRARTARHHTVTHLLHKALREVLGPHAVQAGSLVSPRVARFDFANPGPVAPDQLREVERAINAQILRDLPVTTEIMPYAEAMQQGVWALFGEKYGDQVRVVRVGDYSQELCGGTHVHHSGEIGSAYIVSESGIGSGMRRVEVVAGPAALEWVASRLALLERIATTVGAPVDAAAERVQALTAELQAARRELSRLEAALANARAAELVETAQQVDGLRVVAARVEASSMDALGHTVDRVRGRLGPGVVVLGAVINSRPMFVASVSPEAQRRGLTAGALVGRVAAVTGGGGGGRPDFARAGGKDASQLDAALALVPELVRSALRSDGQD